MIIKKIILQIFKKIKKTLKRKNLKKNEIYFTIACSTILGLAAIYISFKANEIAEKQYQMDYFENRPEFIIKIDTVRSRNRTEISVQHISGKAKNIESSMPISVLDIETTGKDGIIKGSTFLIYNNFVGVKVDYPNGNYRRKVRGLIDNNYNSSMLMYEVGKQIRKKYNRRALVDIKIFISVSYRNFENIRIKEYYSISPFSGHGILVSDTIAMKAYLKDFFPNHSSDDQIELMDINKIDVKKILDKHEKYKIRRETSYSFLESLFCK